MHGRWPRRRTRPGSFEIQPVLERIVLLQADLDDIPFREDSFQTILSMNVLHHSPDVNTVLVSLKNLLTKSGHIYLTSLVKNNRLIGDQYLSLLRYMGWLAEPRKESDLRKLLQDSLKTSVKVWTVGNMAYATTGIADSDDPRFLVAQSQST